MFGLTLKKNGKMPEEEAKIVADLIKKAEDTKNMHECISCLKKFTSIAENSKRKEIYEPSDATKIILSKIYGLALEKTDFKDAIEEIIGGNGKYRPIKQELTSFNLTPEKVMRYSVGKKLQEKLDEVGEKAKSIKDLNQEGQYNLKLISNYESALSNFANLSNNLEATAYGITFGNLKKTFDHDEIDKISVKARTDNLSNLVKEKPRVLAAEQTKRFYNFTKEKIKGKNQDIDFWLENLDKEYVGQEQKYTKQACAIQDRLYENALKQAELRGKRSAELDSDGHDLINKEFKRKGGKNDSAYQGAISAFLRYSRKYMGILEESEEGLKNCTSKIEEVHRTAYYKVTHPNSR